ncbi:restriction endonuclease subunit S [Nosocomiicoccus ampullae]|uniref:restriction endonuclease subunit S n=1 Tax=Nosocomiicoccus ampullae TaxID=489910 RepID=UPI0025509077|nr:restriction endonuclease subunit S [Nosocomiicoccus ampullae]MDK6863936.1 restriction endonuclease subunit S [Nosocomiicoccus ampullae]
MMKKQGKQRLVPKLRFKGFSEDWEQEKLKNVVERVTRKNNGKTDLPLTISAQDGLVDQRHYFKRQVASKNMDNYILIKKGEYAYNKSYSKDYPFGAIKMLKKYDYGALSTLYIVFKTTNISQRFLESYYESHYWHKEINKIAAEGARNHGLLNLSTQDFFKTNIKIPSTLEEQLKISNIVNQLDSLITLHKRKIQVLKDQKNLFLNKIFISQHGDIQLRFKGFTEPWEQRKLKDMYEIIMGQSPLSKNYTEDYKYDILVQGNADLKDGKVIPRIYTKQVTKLAKPNSIIFTVRAPVGQIAINTKKVVIGRGVCSIEGDKFLYHKLEQLNNIKYWNKFSTGSTFDSINSNDLKNMVLHIPKNIEEKNRISHILDILDSMITLHNKKLNRLESLKKEYLNYLFI